VTVPIVWGVLSFLGAAFLGMLLTEVHESASIIARFLVGRAVRRLSPDMCDVRREEWLAELDAMGGCTSCGCAVPSATSSPRFGFGNAGSLGPPVLPTAWRNRRLAFSGRISATRRLPPSQTVRSVTPAAT
jgi:hypothetical protein